MQWFDFMSQKPPSFKQRRSSQRPNAMCLKNV